MINNKLGKFNFLLALYLCISFSIIAQQPIIETTVIDLGEIYEAGGKVQQRVSIKNGSTNPFKIVNILASCGCTTPKWSNEEILNSRPGYFDLEFDPKGRPGEFEKMITLSFSNNLPDQTLFLKGKVILSKPQNFKTEPIKYVKYFGYNQILSYEDLKSDVFFKDLYNKIKQDSISIQIVSSASFLPTKTYTTNSNLVNKRNESATNLINRILSELNYDLNKIKSLTKNTIIQENKVDIQNTDFSNHQFTKIIIE